MLYSERDYLDICERLFAISPEHFGTRGMQSKVLQPNPNIRKAAVENEPSCQSFGLISKLVKSTLDVGVAAPRSRLAAVENIVQEENFQTN